MKISIIIPVYNKEKFLSRCFDSILNQISMYDNRFEIIVVDDGSTDDSLLIANSYAARCPLFRIIKQENMGVSIARNVGIDAAAGKYVVFLDADDELIEHGLLKVYEYLFDNGEVDMLVTLQNRNNGCGDREVAVRGLEEGKVYSGVDAYMKRYVRVNAGGGICRTDFLREYNIKFPEGVRNSEDTIFFGLVQTYATLIAFQKIPFYRIHEIMGSASRVSGTEIALRYVNTVKSAVEIRNQLNCSENQKGIFEFYVFQILSSLIGYFAVSQGLGLQMLREMIDLSKILPINTSHMYMMKHKACLLNFSYRLYFFISWLIH